jgi:hypothetical protein
VPTDQERRGNFSQSLFGVPVDPFTQQPFPLGQIPSQRINDVGRAIAALYPLPNRNVPLQNFVSSPTQHDDNNSFDVRVDHRLTEQMDLAFRYSFGDRDLFEPFTGLLSAVAGLAIQETPQSKFHVRVWVFSPSSSTKRV